MELYSNFCNGEIRAREKRKHKDPPDEKPRIVNDEADDGDSERDRKSKKKRKDRGTDRKETTMDFTLKKKGRIHSFVEEIEEEPDKEDFESINPEVPGVFGTGDKKYHLIVADPPWEYKNNGCRGGTRTQYETMTTDDIKKIPVLDLAAEDCTLFMWCTSPKLGEGMELMRDWGFSYLGVLTWAKLCPKSPKLYMGLGWWFRSCCEFVLFGARGKPRRFKHSNSIKSLFFAKTGKHSRKPMEKFRSIMEKMWGENYYKMNKIELFARETDPDWEWDTWGDELEFAKED